MSNPTLEMPPCAVLNFLTQSTHPPTQAIRHAKCKPPKKKKERKKAINNLPPGILAHPVALLPIIPPSLPAGSIHHRPRTIQQRGLRRDPHQPPQPSAGHILHERALGVAVLGLAGLLALFDLRNHALEGLGDVFVVTGAGFHEAAAQFVGELFAVGERHLALFGTQVGFVAHDHDGDVFRTLFPLS